MDSDKDLYQILQVDPAAEPEVVQAAFKRLALKYHPDRNSAPDAHARMQELNEAYAIIGDPYQRAVYDQQRQAQLAAQRRAQDQAHYQAETDRRVEAARQRKEQMAAQRRAENERREQARAASAQRRRVYEEQIRAQQAAQMRAKREKRQREWEAQQATQQEAQSTAEPTATAQSMPIDYPVQEPTATPVVTAESQVWVGSSPGPINIPPLSESERHRWVLQQSRRALQDQIFKLDYGITDAAEQISYWSKRWYPWRIDLKAGQSTVFTIGGAVTIVTILLAVFMLTLGGAAGWAVAFGLVGIGVGGWTWHESLSMTSVRYLVENWTAIKHSREVERQHLVKELKQLEVVMQVSAASSSEFDWAQSSGHR